MQQTTNTAQEGRMEHASRPVALVTGAARGIGAAVARQLAEAGVDVVINYRSKVSRAEAVAAEVRTAGAQALAIQADLTEPGAVTAMAASVAEVFGELAILVLNASGGLEKGRDRDYAMRLNRDAQLATVTALLPLLGEGGVVVFVTSHWAHFYGQQPTLPAYEPVAASKRADEDALRALMPVLAERGVRLVVVSGDVIEGTITPRLLERSAPGSLAVHRTQVGRLPTVDMFAQGHPSALRHTDTHARNGRRTRTSRHPSRARPTTVVGDCSVEAWARAVVSADQ